MAKPCIPNIEWMLAAGIDPKTKLPLKAISGNPKLLKQNIKRQLRIIDEQDAVNRGTWFNLPCNLTSQEVERMLYYKGSLIFFYDKDLEEFFITPYAMCADVDGIGLDCYGRYTYVKPICFVNGADDNKKKTPIDVYFSKKRLKVYYNPILPEDLKEEDLYNSAVIIKDYTQQLAQMIEPRYLINDGLLDVMSDCVPLMRTNLLLSTGVKGMRVNDADQSESVEDANKSLETAALTGTPYVPIIGTTEFQELTDGSALAKAEEYMLAMQSLDNLRLSTYGINNGGLFEKKAHELQSEADINGGPVGLVLQDSVSCRQGACDVINSIWPIGVWYEPSETIIKADLNGDGLMYDRNEGQASGTESGGDDNDSDV